MATSSVRVVIYDTVITAWSQPGGMVWRWGFQKARKVARLGALYAPKRTGAMALGVEAEFESSERDSSTMRVSAPAPALWVHEGTQGPIRPTSGKFLRLSPGGGYGVVIARSVRGQRAQPFLADALEEVMRGL